MNATSGFKCYDQGLLSCPCCGGEAALVTRQNRWKKWYASVSCEFCGLQTGLYTLNEQDFEPTADGVPWVDIGFRRAVVAWNRRTGATT